LLSLQHNNRVYVDNANWHSSTPGGVRWQRGCGGCQQGLGGGGGAVKASSTRPHHADKCTGCDSRPGHHAFAPQTTAQQRRQTAASGHTASVYTHTFNAHTFNGPFSRTTRVGRYQKAKPNWILLKQETVSGSGISWAICKSAPRSTRQITMPAPHHSIFYRPDALPAAQPTASKH